MWREMARLDAQFARRVAEFDTSVEWSVDGSRSAASWLVRNFRLATGEAHHRVRVARQMAQMPVANAAWQAGRISSRHVDVLTSVRHAANADSEFAAFEQYLVDVALDAPARGGRRRRPSMARRARRPPRPRRTLRRSRRRTPSTNGGAANFSRTLNGIGILDGTFDTEGAEIIETALDAATNATTEPTTPAPRPNSAPMRSSTSSSTTSTTKTAAPTGRT